MFAYFEHKGTFYYIDVQKQKGNINIGHALAIKREIEKKTKEVVNSTEIKRRMFSFDSIEENGEKVVFKGILSLHNIPKKAIVKVDNFSGNS
jgi:hypothetical protein